MADFASTNKNASFEAWFEQLCLMAEINGENAGDKETGKASIKLAHLSIQLTTTPLGGYDD